MSEPKNIFDELLVTSCQGLFEVYGVELQEMSAANVETPHSIELAGIIGLTAESLRGTLVLGTTESILKETDDRADGRDWIGELANQLLGRLKNRLFAYGVEIAMSTPVSLRGHNLALTSSSEDTWFYAFQSSAGLVCVWFDLELEPGYTMFKAEEAEESAVEGELMFF